MTSSRRQDDEVPATSASQTNHAYPTRTPSALDVLPFPVPGDLLAAVHTEWDGIEAIGTRLQPDLPRPWDPSTCTASGLHAELATWLAEVVSWINTQHTWHPDTAIPSCWPRHPHLVHELAVLADHRRRASNEPTSLPLEQWQRLTLPSFVDRMRFAVGQHCAADHHDLALDGLPSHLRE